MNSVVLAFTILVAGSSGNDRFCRDDSTGIIFDSLTGLQWMEGPDLETDWLEAFVMLEEMGEGWRSPSAEEAISLVELSISAEDPGPFSRISAPFIWCGDLANFDSIYCYSLYSGCLHRVAEWNAFPYLEGFRLLAVRDPNPRSDPLGEFPSTP